MPLPSEDEAEHGAVGGSTSQKAELLAAESKRSKYEIARARRDELLLKEHDRDENGAILVEKDDKGEIIVPIIPSRHLFPLKAMPKEIGLESTGIGIYLYTLWFFILLLVLQSCVSIFPLINNLATDNFAKEYVLLGPNDSLEGRATSETLCSRQYDPSSAITRMSVGAACPASKFTTEFDCPAVCVPNMQHMQSPVCADVPMPEADGICATYVACRSDTVAATDPLQAKQEYCYCCDMDFYSPDVREKVALTENADYETTKQVTAGQLALPSIMVGIFFLWHLVLVHMQRASADQINESVITAGDYSVWVTGIGKMGEPVSNDTIARWASHYGEVVMSTPILAIGGMIRVGRTLDVLKKQREEIEAGLKDPTRPCFLEWPLYLIFRLLTGGRGESALEANEEKQKRTKEELDRLDKDSALTSNGEALIVFNLENNSYFCLKDHHRDWWAFLTGIRGFLRCFGLFWDAPRFPDAQGRRVAVVRAPEPSDMLWENSDRRGLPVYVRRAATFVLLAVCMVLSGLIQFQISKLAEDERNQRLEEERLSPNNVEAGSTVDAVKMRQYSLMSSVVVVVLNLVLSALIKAISAYEAYPTQSRRAKFHIVRLSIVYIVNTIVVPIWAASRVDTSSWYSRGGLVEQAFYLQITNAFVPDIITLINPAGLFNRMLARYAKTQAILNQLLEPPHFPLAERYSNAVKTIALALFYAPALPVSPMIGAVGICFSYATDQWMALRATRKPANLTPEVTDMINKALNVIPLMQVAAAYLFLDEFHDDVAVAFAVGASLWVAIYIPPWGMLCASRTDTGMGGGTGGRSFLETLGPLTAFATRDDGDESGLAGPDVLSKDQAFNPDIYRPVLPDAASHAVHEGEEVRSIVERRYKPREEPVAPDRELMDNQSVIWGGQNIMRSRPMGGSMVGMVPVPATTPVPVRVPVPVCVSHTQVPSARPTDPGIPTEASGAIQHLGSGHLAYAPAAGRPVFNYGGMMIAFSAASEYQAPVPTSTFGQAIGPPPAAPRVGPLDVAPGPPPVPQPIVAQHQSPGLGYQMDASVPYPVVPAGGANTAAAAAAAAAAAQPPLVPPPPITSPAAAPAAAVGAAASRPAAAYPAVGGIGKYPAVGGIGGEQPQASPYPTVSTSGPAALSEYPPPAASSAYPPPVSEAVPETRQPPLHLPPLPTPAGPNDYAANFAVPPSEASPYPVVPAGQAMYPSVQPGGGAVYATPEGVGGPATGDNIWAAGDAGQQRPPSQQPNI